MNLTPFMTHALGRIFGLGAQFVRAAAYYRPFSSTSSTGSSGPAGCSVPCSMFIASYRSNELGSVVFQPGDEKVLVRATDLASLGEPVEGDYVIESSNSLCRVVHSARLDPSGLLWTLHCSRSPNLDFGDLSPFTDAEDRGDLAPASLFDDFGSLT